MDSNTSLAQNWTREGERERRRGRVRERESTLETRDPPTSSPQIWQNKVKVKRKEEIVFPGLNNFGIFKFNQSDYQTVA